MKLKARLLDIQAGSKSIALLDDEAASLLGVHSSDRIEITYKNEQLIAIVNIASNFPPNQVGFYEEISKKLGVRTGETVEVHPAERPEGLSYVRAKIRGERLRENEIRIIVQDVVERHLSDTELASFVTALHIHGLSMDETEALAKAMVETGSILTLDKSPILDKHSIGGIPGDKTSLLITPIIAAAGFIIPKTSSRAVTSPAGTADRVETLCPVNLTIEEIKEVVNKTNGCMVWGGAMELAPADDIFIQIEYPLAIDPLLLPSIMSKKKAIGATHVIIDIPTGRGTKTKTIGQAEALAYDFIDLGKRLGTNVQCAITFGEQPIGYAIGPALEAREALSTILGNGPVDLKEKAINVAGILFEMVGLENGKQKAEALLKSGKAEKKLREIIEAQGGNPKIKVGEIEVGDKKAEITAIGEGRVLRIDNRKIAQVAREAGAPREKGAGVTLYTKLGDHVKKDGVIFRIHAERNTKLEAAIELAKKLQPVELSKRPEERMLMARVPTRIIRKKTFMLER
ncbi:MAG: AMP phosphorylase [Candidatus Bathyarchaeota archaeon]|nr:MAG: AMP phosphorylase [Candidatus Bathyarchaeota archaeon]UCE57528.1 MAG: AMP phosphorylase [Candidatus Bathyarchaeota archaeon]